LTAIQIPRTEQVARLKVQRPAHDLLRNVLDPLDLHLANGDLGPRIHLEHRLSKPVFLIDVEVPVHLGERVSQIGQPDADGVGRGEQQQPIEGIADVQRQRIEDLVRRHDLLEPAHRNRVHPHRFAFLDLEPNPGFRRCPAHDRIDRRVDESALTVQRGDPQHVAAKLGLVQVALLPEPDPTDERIPREPRGLRRLDGSPQLVVADGTVPVELHRTHHQAALGATLGGSGDGGRGSGDRTCQREQIPSYGANLPSVADGPNPTVIDGPAEDR
jgi:hypothetical protein